MQTAFYLKAKKKPALTFDRKKRADEKSFLNAFFPLKGEKDAGRTCCASVKVQR